MAAYVDASLLAAGTSPEPESMLADYPTPSSVSTASHSVEPESYNNKKKRKAWGQPVPPINPILPPRKRAKTAEEKEQRKNERILRNRRAADKSRQRQKAAVADLERRQHDIEAENAQLKDILAQYQKQFGQIPGCEFKPQLKSFSYTSTPSVVHDAQTTYDNDMMSQVSSTPILAATELGSSPFEDESPALTPALNLGEVARYSSSVNASSMTQYPAVVLCDLQCQPEKLTSKLRSLQPNHRFSTILTLIHCLTILQASSTKMLSQMYQTFRLLAETLSTNSSQQLESLIQHNFHLIHILISMPSTSTRPAVFRLRLLSRLLACNPNLAHLLENAADRALQQKVSEETWAEDAGSRWTWASLMTIKWSIRYLEREHSKIRTEVRAGVLDRQKWIQMKGVDYGAVETTVRLWDGFVNDTRCITIMREEPLFPMNSTEVH